MASQNRPSAMRSGLVEVFWVWLAFALFLLVLFVTYSRSQPEPLYNTSHEGITNGASRALVFLGFPTGFGIIATIGVVYLVGRETRLPRLWLAGGALASVVLCATAAVPGVVEQNDLDAKPVNALAALGVALGLGLTVWVGKAGGIRRPAPWNRLDIVRIALAAALLVLALPWLAAELGFDSDEVPILRDVFLDYDRRTQGDDGGLEPAVHAGDHHGMNGVLLTTVVLALSRTLPLMRPSAGRTVLGGYLSLGLVYGVANAVQDGWNEQLVKRDLVTWEFPSVLEPAPTLAWVILLVCAAGLWVAWEACLRDGAGSDQRPRTR